MTSPGTESGGSDRPASPSRLTLTEADIEVVDVDADRRSVMAAAELQVMTYEPRDYRDIFDDRPPPPLPSPPTDLSDANNDSDGHDGDAFGWP